MPGLFPDSWGSFFGGSGAPSTYPWLGQGSQQPNTGMDPAAQSLAAGGPPLAPGMTPDQLSQLASLNQPSLWDQLSKGIGSQAGRDAIKQIGSGLAPMQQPTRPQMPLPPQMPFHQLSPYSIYRYGASGHAPLDPEAAFRALQMGA
jgi:hypothetical protein